MPQPTVPAPRTPLFLAHARCPRCGTTAGRCALVVSNRLDEFDRLWAAGEHNARRLAPDYLTPEQLEDRRLRARASTENNARCCAGCTMHGY